MVQGPHYRLDDGLGVRSVGADESHGPVEVLDVAPELASYWAVEQAIRGRADHQAGIDASVMAPVWRIERDGSVLRIVAEAPQGLRLSHLLADLEFGNEALTDAALLELAAAIVEAVSTLHQVPGGVAHGAISPAHVVITRDGAAVLTDGVFGVAIEELQLNRKQLWHEFGLALPPAASLPRFDQRADVTGLGAIVLALLMHRPLRPEEYPGGIGDLVVLATPDDYVSHASGLRMWLQQALQIHPRFVFTSGVDAQQMFADLIAPGPRRTALQAVRKLVRRRTPSVSNLRAS